MYKYETHLHTAPVSKCAGASVRETLEFYKKTGYDGVFITNHFLDGHVNIDYSRPFKEKIDFYFSDYEEGVKLGKELGIKVFLGVEISYCGTDFLIYGLDKKWYSSNPELLEMTMKEKLARIREGGGFIVHAHPFREARYIDHIRLFPQSIDAVEAVNACRTDFENRMAHEYAKNYGFFEVAGSDNHYAEKQEKLAGVQTKQPINSERDYIEMVKSGQVEIFG